MTLWRGLLPRVVLASMLCTLVGLVAAASWVRYATRDAIVRDFGPRLVDGYRRYALARCEASPASFALALEPGATAFAYDAATLASRNPAAPPLDRALLAQLEERGPAAATDTQASFRGGTLVFRGAESGPCAIVQGRWEGTRHGRGVPLRLALAMTMVMAAAFFGFVAVFRPTAQRIDRLRRAAERVGEPEGYAPADEGRDELGALSTSLDRAHARIRADTREREERARALERHLADVAHDLRTPLASIQLAMERASDASADPALTEIVVGALAEVVYVSALTEDLRMASRLRDGWQPAGEDARVLLDEVVERVVTRARPLARRRGIGLEMAKPDGEVIVRCHPVAAEQAVGNLVQNAIAYGDRGGHVGVVLDRTADGRFTLVVRDDGPGVAPAELPRLGERTFRSDEARRRDPRGSGLGLAITAAVCEAAGFALTFESEVPRGLRVTVRGDTLA
ncbi:MAG: HAMP domain-containing sensor histidine kinase [Minicystis sp.]